MTQFFNIKYSTRWSLEFQSQGEQKARSEIEYGKKVLENKYFS